MPVYLLRVVGADAVKIGYSDTRHLSARLQTIQTCNHQRLELIRLLDGGKSLETALHQQFAPRLIRGEWFTFHIDMLGDLGAADLPLAWAPSEQGNVWTDERRALAAEYAKKADHSRAPVEAIKQAGGRVAVARALGVPPETVKSWSKRGIPPRYWQPIADLAQKRGHNVTALRPVAAA